MRPTSALFVVLLSAPVRAQELSPKQIYQQASPAVVLLVCVGADGNGELGTGSIIDQAGHILTNAHVVLQSNGQPFDNLHVYFKPNPLSGDPKRDLTGPRTASVVKADRAMDLAILQLNDKPDSLTVLPIGDASKVEAGEPVVAIGHPEQGGLWTLTSGVVSTVIADLGGVPGKDVFQTDASINRGNSGGPLINRSGALIGVNTSMARKAADGLAITSVNFSIKSNVVKGWLASSNLGVTYAEAPAASLAQAAPAPAPAPAPALVPDQAAPAPAAPAPDQAAPEPDQTAPVVAKAPPQSKPAKAVKAAPAKAAIVTPAKPYSITDVIQQEIAEMENLTDEMEKEVEKHRAELNKK